MSGFVLVLENMKVMEFDHLDSRLGNSCNFCPGLGNVVTFDIGQYVCSRPACYS